MTRKFDTLEYRNRRFLKPLFEYTFPALVIFFGLNEIVSMLISYSSKVAPSAQIDFNLPSIVWYALGAYALIGILSSSWRFYRDHICHERFDGLL